MAGYAADLTLKAKLLTVNSRGVLPISSAVEMQITTASRSRKPLPPGNVKINGLGYDAWPASTTGVDVTLSWNHRNRVDQGVGTKLVAQDIIGAYAIEGTLTIEVLINNVVKRTVTGLTGTSFVYTRVMRQADEPTAGLPVKFRITPINGIYTGPIRTTPSFIMGL